MPLSTTKSKSLKLLFENIRAWRSAERECEELSSSCRHKTGGILTLRPKKGHFDNTSKANLEIKFSRSKKNLIEANGNLHAVITHYKHAGSRTL